MVLPSNFVRSINLKNKTFSYLSEKKKTIWDVEATEIGKSNKQRRRTLFYGEGGSWEGLCGMIYWGRTRAQGDDRFSLVELQGWSNYRRCDVHLSLLGPVIEDSFLLMILVLGSVINNFLTIDAEWYSSSSPASPSSLPSLR